METARNFRATDWEELKEAMDDELLEMEPPRELGLRTARFTGTAVKLRP